MDCEIFDRKDSVSEYKSIQLDEENKCKLKYQCYHHDGIYGLKKSELSENCNNTFECYEIDLFKNVNNKLGVTNQKCNNIYYCSVFDEKSKKVTSLAPTNEACNNLRTCYPSNGAEPFNITYDLSCSEFK